MMDVEDFVYDFLRDGELESPKSIIEKAIQNLVGHSVVILDEVVEDEGERRRC